ncbi:MAG TPA: Cj0069 family protein [Usitatibacter sp.]|nr:Cj0069 family protein [Usitatibacter sp.]
MGSNGTRVAILDRGDREARRRSAPGESRFLPLFRALADLGAQAERAVYDEEFADEVRRQLLGVDGVLVWVNPLQDGRDRTVLDAILREAATAGVFVSGHPDVIAKLGTKEVLFTTRDIGWGCDTHLYRSAAQMRAELPARLAGGARVLKQLRGNGGTGVWKVERDGGSETSVRVRHAERGAAEERMTLDSFCRRCEAYFGAGGGMLDQEYQARLAEGMVRCYLVGGRVEGFGVQAINALHPPPPGAPVEAAPRPTPRTYHPPTLPAYQSLKRQLEADWVPAAQRRLGIETRALPLLWDCDFLLGPRTAAGADTYVLCEINASSVSPFPESAIGPLARAAVESARQRRR